MMLEGIKVLDLSRILAGPYAAMMLADLGADVIKLERPGRGDDLRWLRGGRGITASFASCNRNKRSIAVDLRHPEGQRVAFTLARQADVVLENFLPGETRKFGLSYEQVKAANPAVVYASITGFGQDGPLARRAGYNSVALAMSGLMAITGMPGHGPTRPGGSLADLSAAYLAFGAISAALVKRFRRGEGTYIDVNLLASTLGMIPDPVANYFETGERPRRLGNRSPSVTPGEVFPTSDGMVIIVLTSPEQWGRFCAELGDVAMKDDPRFATNADRLANHAEFKARVDALLAVGTTDQWVERLARQGIAVGPVYEFDEVFEDPQVRHLGLVQAIEHPGVGMVKMLGTPYRTEPPVGPVRRPAPWLGEHTAQVLAEYGFGADEIARLAAAKAVELGGPPAN